jgi:hypothetical protein
MKLFIGSVYSMEKVASALVLFFLSQIQRSHAHRVGKLTQNHNATLIVVIILSSRVEPRK